MFHWYGYIYTPDRKVTVCFIGMAISIPIIGKSLYVSLVWLYLYP